MKLLCACRIRTSVLVPITRVISSILIHFVRFVLTLRRVRAYATANLSQRNANVRRSHIPFHADAERTSQVRSEYNIICSSLSQFICDRIGNAARATQRRSKVTYVEMPGGFCSAHNRQRLVLRSPFLVPIVVVGHLRPCCLFMHISCTRRVSNTRVPMHVESMHISVR